MRSSVALSPVHYATSWPADSVRTPAQVTVLGREFVNLPEGLKKDEKLLEILQCFHGYLMKYVSTILRGRLPLQKNGRSKEVNSDTLLLLRCFISREQSLNRASLGAACRTLHLAFKGMGIDETYDQLMMCLVKAIRRYDPYYIDKVKATVQMLETRLADRKKFTASEVSAVVGYETASYLRVLIKRGYLMLAGTKLAGESQFQRTEMWPVPATLFQNGAVGLSYVASKWFRYYLIDYIHWRMSEIEAKEGMLQLNEPGRMSSSVSSMNNHSDRVDWPLCDRGLPSLLGNLTLAHSGKSVAADISLNHLPVDIGRMSLAWVNEEQRGLFETLSKHDRHLLYCVFVRDMDWESIANTFGISTREAKRTFQQLIFDLQLKVGTVKEEDRIAAA